MNYPGKPNDSHPGIKIPAQTGKLFENSAASKPERRRKREKENSATMHEEGGVPRDSSRTLRLKTSPLGCRIRAGHSFSFLFPCFFHQSLSLTPPPTPQAQTLEKARNTGSFGRWCYCCMKWGAHCDVNTDPGADSWHVQNSVDSDGGRGALVTGVISKDHQQPLESWKWLITSAQKETC